MITSSASKVTRQGQLRDLISGIDKHFATVTTLTLGGTPYTPADLKKLLQADIDASDASVQAKAAWRADVQNERDSHVKVNPIVRMLRFYVITQFGETQDASQKLADFGLSPRKTTKRTIATKANAVAQSKATRTARSTLGPRQKAQVKGTVAPKAVTSAPAPAAGSTPAATAGAISGATSGPPAVPKPTSTAV